MKNYYKAILSIIVLVCLSILILLPLFVLAAPANCYWVGGAGNYGDPTNHWATSSNGTPDAGNLPGTTTNVFFDQYSFTDYGQYVSTDNGSCTGANHDWTGALYNPTLRINAASLGVTGNLILIPDMTINATGSGSLTIANAVAKTITTAGVAIPVPFSKTGIGSTTLLDSTNITSRSLTALNLNAGSLTTNNNPLYVAGQVAASGNNSRTMNLGSSDVYVGGWNYNGTNLTFNPGTSTLYVTGPEYSLTTTNFTMAGGNLTYNKVNMLANYRTITGSNNMTELNFAMLPQVYLLGDSLSHITYGGHFNLKIGNTEYVVVDKAVGGNKIADIASRLDADALDQNAGAIVFWCGTNDIAAGDNATVIEAGLANLYSRAHDAGALVVAATITPRDSANATQQTAIDAVNAWILGPPANVDYAVDLYSVIEDPGNPDHILPAYNSDGIHLNSVGYTVVANTIAASTDFTGISGGEQYMFITGSNNITSLNVDVTQGAVNLFFSGNTTQTITNFSANGTADHMVSMNGTSGDWNIAKAGGGEVHVSYMVIANSTASPASTWYADSTCIDGGNNIGWLFVEPPTVTTSAATDVSYTSVTGNGEITNVGTDNATERGFQYGIGEYSDNVSEAGDFAAGAFDLPITGLTPGTEYQYRAYAINSDGIGYGDLVNFTTTATGAPELSKVTISSITSSSATASSNITSINGSNATIRGFEYGIGAYTDNATEEGSFGVGVFSLPLSSLSANTTYQVRPFAVNGAGVGYGESDNFTTSVASTPPAGSSTTTGSTTSGTGATGELSTTLLIAFSALVMIFTVIAFWQKDFILYLFVAILTVPLAVEWIDDIPILGVALFALTVYEILLALIIVFRTGGEARGFSQFKEMWSKVRGK